jgi:hypothetical protein
MLDKVAEAMVGVYAERTKGDAGEIREWMRAETWMTAAECVERGFADETFQQDEDARASAMAFVDSPIFASFRNTPAILLASAQFSPSAGAPGRKQESDTMKVFSQSWAWPRPQPRRRPSPPSRRFSLPAPS